MGREIKTSRAARSKHLGCTEALYWATSLQCLGTGFAGRKPQWLEALFVLTRSETTPVPPVSLSTVCTTYSILPVLREFVGLLPHPELLLPWKTLSCTLLSSAMGNFSLSVQLLFVSRCPFCSAWWMRYGTCKEMPAFGRGLPYNFIGLFLRNGQRKISVVAGKSCSIPRF